MKYQFSSGILAKAMERCGFVSWHGFRACPELVEGCRKSRKMNAGFSP
jgi:hypothetical protein